jgi:hypothetical protein
LIGSQGSDTFVLGVNQGSDGIMDFQEGIDKIALIGNLNFNQLQITQGSTGAILKLSGNGDVLAQLVGIQASQLQASSFLNI